jgi:hypothetical protein
MEIQNKKNDGLYLKKKGVKNMWFHRLLVKNIETYTDIDQINYKIPDF